MLDKIRVAISSWIVKFLIILVLIGFAFWEIPAIFHYNNSNNDNILLSSGNSIIKSQAYQTNLIDSIMRASYHAGHYLTPEEITQLQIPQMVMHQMQTNILLDEIARRLKVGASSKSLSLLLNEDPFFKGKNGHFDKEGFFSYARLANLTHNEIFDLIAKQTLRNQLILSITDGITVPDVISLAFSRYLGERRSVTYLELSKNIIPPLENPDEESFSQWFSEKNALFWTPEYRRVSFMQLSATDVACPQVTPEEIKNVYENNIDQYVTQEQRIFEKLQFEKQEQAEAAVQQLKKGVPFPSLVAKMGQTLKKIRSPLITKTDLPDLFVQDVFSLKKGAVSPIIDSFQGPVLVRVVEIKPAEIKPLEAVTEEIRKNIILHKTRSILEKKMKEIEEARFEGTSLHEVANKYKLSFREGIFDIFGKTPAGSFIENFPNSPLFISHVFQSAEGVDNNPLFIKDGYVWYQVEEIIPSHANSLAEVRRDALALWKKERVDYLLDEKANLLIRDIKNGKSFQIVASENALSIKNENDLQRIRVNESLGKEATLAAFSGKIGFITITRGKDETSRIILQVTNVVYPEPTEDYITINESNELSIGIKNDLLQQLLFLANKEHPVKINSVLYNNTIRSF